MTQSGHQPESSCCGSEVGFQHYQSTRLSRYDALSGGWRSYEAAEFITLIGGAGAVNQTLVQGFPVLLNFNCALVSGQGAFQDGKKQNKKNEAAEAATFSSNRMSGKEIEKEFAKLQVELVRL